MIKRAVVEIGKTPSELSGKKSTKFKDDGSVLCDNEKLKSKGMAKQAMQKIVEEEKKEN